MFPFSGSSCLARGSHFCNCSNEFLPFVISIAVRVDIVEDRLLSENMMVVYLLISVLAPADEFLVKLFGQMMTVGLHKPRQGEIIWR